MRPGRTAIHQVVDLSWAARIVLCAILLLRPLGTGAEGPPRRLIVRADGDRLEWGYTEPLWAEWEGNVRIYFEIEGEPDKRAAIHADRAALRSGRIEAHNGIVMDLEGGILTGEYLEVNPETGEFCLTQARSAANLTAGSADGRPVRGYAFGEEIVGNRELVYIIDGKMTTCDRPRPHYALRAKRIEYRPAQQRVKVKGAAVYLYGTKIPLIPSFSLRLAAEGREAVDVLPMPGYSSRDELYLPYRFHLSHPDSPWRSDLNLRVTQKRGLRAVYANQYTSRRWQAAGYVSQTEDVHDDVGHWLTLDRRPELTVTRFAASPDQKDGWRASLSLASIIEEQVANTTTTGAQVREQRAAASVRRDWHTDQRRQGRGLWYSLSARQALYSSGDDYHDLALSVGAGGALGSNMTGALTLTRHLTGGRTPLCLIR